MANVSVQMSDDHKVLFPATVLAKARPITTFGVDLSWPVSAAREVIASLEGTSTAILGGDVYVNDNNTWEVAIPNWDSEIRAGEPWQNYAARSRDDSIKFLNEHYANKNAWFVLVVASKPSAAQLATSYER